MGKLRVVVDREACIGCGVAPATCPDVFVLGDDNGKNRVREEYSVETNEKISIGEVPEDLKDCVQSAIDSCPVQAIRFEK
jgi:ferredoxin